MNEIHLNGISKIILLSAKKFDFLDVQLPVCCLK